MPAAEAMPLFTVGARPTSRSLGLSMGGLTISTNYGAETTAREEIARLVTEGLEVRCVEITTLLVLVTSIVPL